MKDAIFYHIYPLGLLGAPKHNDTRTKVIERLKELEPWLDHMLELGCNALYLGPVFESNSHGYDTTDYYRVDRRLGTTDSLRNLIQSAHSKKIKVILDGVFNHVGREFWAFRDLREKGQNSKYKDWFSMIDFTKRSPMGDTFSYSAWRGHYQLVELNLNNKEVRKHLFGAVLQWIEEFNIDGLRLDTADVLDFDFIKALSAFCRAQKLDFWLMGEVVQGNYSKWVTPKMLDSVTNYDYHTPIYESFNTKGFHEIARILKRQYGPKGIYSNLTLYSFIDNHDVDRAASKLVRPEHLYPLYLLLFTLPGIPALYYGSEWGLEGKKETQSDDKLRPKVTFTILEQFAKHSLLVHSIKRFIALRKKSKALAHGAYQEVSVSKKHFLFRRKYKNESLLIAINASSRTKTVQIALEDSSKAVYVDLLDPDFVISGSNGALSIEVPKFGGRILRH